MPKHVYTRIPSGFLEGILRLVNFEDKIKSATVLTGFLSCIMLQKLKGKYMFLPGCYLLFRKAVCFFLIFKMKQNLLPGITRFISGIMMQKLKCKYMFLPGSHLVFCKPVAVLLFLKMNENRLPGSTRFISGIRIQ